MTLTIASLSVVVIFVCWPVIQKHRERRFYGRLVARVAALEGRFPLDFNGEAS